MRPPAKEHILFKVENADFIAEKLAAELLPDQEYREAYVNAEEALVRRIRADVEAQLVPREGRIEFDVDWALHQQQGDLWYLSVADNGDGMNRAELERYTTTLAVTGANQNQSITGNQGMGLKISGPTRHREGILIRSLKDGQRSMVQIGWTGIEYDLKGLNDNGDVVVEVPESLFPDFILEQGSGTVVTFLGSSPGANTLVPEGRPRIWLFKYLHQRFFRLGEGDFKLIVRQPARDVSQWPPTREAADAADFFNKAEVIGTGGQWDRYSDRLKVEKSGGDMRGVAPLPGLPSAGVPAARMHWWVLPPAGPGIDLTSRTFGGGSLAVLYQNELHDWRVSGQANPFFARLGIIFGKQRIAFVLEPVGDGIHSDFARAHVLVGGRPVFEGDAWAVWADQFRERMPDAIRETIAEEQQRLHDEDPDRAKRIRDRLKDVMSMLRPKRARRDPAGSTSAAGDETPGSGGEDGASYETPVGPGPRQRNPHAQRGIGALLPQVDDGDSATEVFSMLHLTPRWVTEAEAETSTIVNANGKGLRDRAAALAGVDGLTAPELLLSLEFRGYKMIIEHLNDWGNPDGDDLIAAAIEQHTQEWIEQKMVESITGLRQLANGSTWTPTAYDDALSPVALTTAFMADRYHTVREVKRLIGPMRQRPAAPAVAATG